MGAQHTDHVDGPASAPPGFAHLARVTFYPILGSETQLRFSLPGIKGEWAPVGTGYVMTEAGAGRVPLPDIGAYMAHGVRNNSGDTYNMVIDVCVPLHEYPAAVQRLQTTLHTAPSIGPAKPPLDSFNLAGVTPPANDAEWMNRRIKHARWVLRSLHTLMSTHGYIKTSRRVSQS